MNIIIIDDDEIMRECIVRALGNDMGVDETRCFDNALAAMTAIDEQIPDLIILDIVLNGPDGFSFLNELLSYNDTMQIPVLVITSLDLSGVELTHYGVRKVLQKETMTPAEIHDSVQEILSNAK